MVLTWAMFSLFRNLTGANSHWWLKSVVCSLKGQQSLRTAKYGLVFLKFGQKQANIIHFWPSLKACLLFIKRLIRPLFSLFFLCHFQGHCRSHGSEKLPHRNILQQLNEVLITLRWQMVVQVTWSAFKS